MADYFEIWKVAVNLLFSKYLVLTIITYILFIVALAVCELLERMADYTFYYFCVFLLFAVPILRWFEFIDKTLRSLGITLPEFFMK